MFLPLLTALAASIGPGMQPQLSADGARVALAYGMNGMVHVAVSHDGGRTFAAPARVAKGEKLALGRHRGPRVALSGGAIVVSAIYGGQLASWRSTDNGATWSAPVNISDTPDAAREGLHAMAAGPRGLLFATWLDLRSTGMKLYGSLSSDGGLSWSKNTLVYASPDGSVCNCCHPSVMIASDGAITVMWRNALAGNRDMYLARSTDGGKSFTGVQKLGVESWQLNACPMDGGGVALSNGKFVTAWRRGSEVFFARPGEPEQKLGPGKDPSIAAGKSGHQVLWVDNGTVRGWPAKVDAPGAYPQLVPTSSGLLAAWESNGSIEVRPLP